MMYEKAFDKIQKNTKQHDIFFVFHIFLTFIEEITPIFTKITHFNVFFRF